MIIMMITTWFGVILRSNETSKYIKNAQISKSIANSKSKSRHRERKMTGNEEWCTLPISALLYIPSDFVRVNIYSFIRSFLETNNNDDGEEGLYSEIDDERDSSFGLAINIEDVFIKSSELKSKSARMNNSV